MFKSLLLVAAVTTSAFAGVIPNEDAEGLEKRVTTCPSYEQMVLNNHNQHRANHSAPALFYNATASGHANQWASQCSWGHNTQYGEGQNIAVYPTAREGIAAWYNSEVSSFNGQYGKATPDTSNFGSWGHFSQVVWKSTTGVGCGTAFCPSMKNLPGFNNVYFTVCNYYPPGNYLGQFDKNVSPPRGAGTQGPVC